ncbi:MAG: hypothetical protein JEZ11_20440 [Desulfobacterales bacterium]|nr:hypothetical protein [Desulfobacterales bacterium]
MKGNIYSTKRGPICGGPLKHDENRSGLFCANHPQVRATKGFMVRFGREITKRHKTYLEASRFLTGVRFKTNMFFYRHVKGNGNAKPGTQFGKDYLYKWWKQACKNLDIEGVDLYGGTRHSTTTALAEHFTKDELRESGTMHATNQAFERYMQAKKNDSLIVYKKSQEIRTKILELKKK